MTSLELVEFINSQRGEDEPELRHDNFMAKVLQVLGEIGALNFKGTYRDLQALVDLKSRSMVRVEC